MDAPKEFEGKPVWTICMSDGDARTGFVMRSPSLREIGGRAFAVGNLADVKRTSAWWAERTVALPLDRVTCIYAMADDEVSAVLDAQEQRPRRWTSRLFGDNRMNLYGWIAAGLLVFVASARLVVRAMRTTAGASPTVEAALLLAIYFVLIGLFGLLLQSYCARVAKGIEHDRTTGGAPGAPRSAAGSP